MMFTPPSTYSVSPGQAARVGRREERAGEADVHDVDELADRRALRGLVQQQVEILEPGGGARLERPGRDRVHADALRGPSS